MKRCPQCMRDYFDDSLFYCLDDGAQLLDGPSAPTHRFDHEAITINLPSDWKRLVGTRHVSAEGAIHRRRGTHGELIGRADDIEAVTKLLLESDSRLVTLTGIGGTGKTRLSIELAHRLQPEFSDGVYLVELSRITDERLVAPAIAHAIGIAEAGRLDVLDCLTGYLDDRSVLLVLDNMEQVIEGGVRLARLLAETTRLKMLVTSREALGLSSETEYRLAPLALPDPEPRVEDMVECGSVQLFVERAKAAWSDFELTAANAVTIAAICRKLDGIPLAIELAAARIQVLSLDEILSKLEDSLMLLTGGGRDLPDRQQTMRGAIQWSYDLLTSRERTAFSRLAVFSGGFTLADAETVIAGDGISTVDVLDLVSSLAAKSLLLMERSEAGLVRFRMLQLVRDLATESLAQIDPEGAARRSHAEYFLSVAEEAAPHLMARDTGEWLARLGRDHDNLRTAVSWALASDIEIAGRMIVCLRNFWTTRGHIREGRNWFERALETGGDWEPGLKWELLTGLGNMAQFQGDHSFARDCYQRSLEVARLSDDQKKLARSLRGLAAEEYIQGDMSPARERITEALAISEALGDEFGVAAALSRLGDLAVAEGCPEEGRPIIRESLELFRRLGYRLGIMAKLNNLAAADLLLGDTESARAHLTESVETSREMGDRINLRTSLEGFAALLFMTGEHWRAAQVCGAASALGETIGIELEPVEQGLVELYRDSLRAALSEDDFARAFEEGRRMRIDSAIDLALVQKWDRGE